MGLFVLHPLLARASTSCEKGSLLLLIAVRLYMALKGATYSNIERSEEVVLRIAPHCGMYVRI